VLNLKRKGKQGNTISNNHIPHAQFNYKKIIIQ